MSADDNGGNAADIEHLLATRPEDLTPFHSVQLESYLKFARYKREEHVRDVRVLFEETQEAQLSDDHYTRDEVEMILNSIQDALRANVDKELQHMAHVNTLLLKSMFVQAEEIMLDLHADTKHLENERLLKEIKNFEDVSMSGNKKLDALSAATTGDAALRHNIDQLKNRNSTLAERFKELQRQHIENAKEKTALQEEIEQLKRSAGGVPEAEVDALREKLKAAERKAQEAERDLLKKVQQTAPFRNLRGMLQKKNQQMKLLREALMKYEPDTVAKLAEMDVDRSEDVPEADAQPEPPKEAETSSAPVKPKKIFKRRQAFLHGGEAETAELRQGQDGFS